jgi:hypothetical protein
MLISQGGIERRTFIAGGLAGLLAGARPANSKEGQSELLIMRTCAYGAPPGVETTERILTFGEPLMLCLDPNRYEPPIYSIALFTLAGECFGCLPPDRVEPIARLIQAGRKLTARILHPGPKPRKRWHMGDPDIGVFLVSA